MNQHPVPQNVTQYQFRLVGDMTLKQFLELATGLILAILFYSSNLLFFFKIPLILLSVFFGIALAFFPIEDRPLDQWIINFIKSIYRPTRFIWKKSNKVPSIFSFVAHPIAPTNTITKTIKAPILSPKANSQTDLTLDEDSQVKSLNLLFKDQPSDNTASTTSPKVAQDIFDKPTITIRKLKAESDTVLPPPPPKPKNTTPLAPIVPPPNNLIFKSEDLRIAPPPKSTPNTKLKSISLPITPKVPNLIVGVTTSKEGKLVEGAIVQVLDSSGVPARAIKTNALGQFATSTPLSPGTYRVEVESDGHAFPAQQLIINNTIIQPFEIQAT